MKVDVFVGTEHVPMGLKAGTLVDLKLVTGKTVAPRGRTLYATSPVAAGVEVALVAPVEKPAHPEAAVRVQLLAAKDLAAKIEKARDQIVDVVERQPDGVVASKKKAVTLRIELPGVGKK